MCIIDRYSEGFRTRAHHACLACEAKRICLVCGQKKVADDFTSLWKRTCIICEAEANRSKLKRICLVCGQEKVAEDFTSLLKKTCIVCETEANRSKLECRRCNTVKVVEKFQNPKDKRYHRDYCIDCKDRKQCGACKLWKVKDAFRQKLSRNYSDSCKTCDSPNCANCGQAFTGKRVFKCGASNRWFCADEACQKSARKDRETSSK